MKAAQIKYSIELDRLATLNEVRFAMRLSSQTVFTFACEEPLDLDSDGIGCACDLSEDMLWLAIVNEMPDTPSN